MKISGKIIYLNILAVGILLAGCDDSLLDKQPLTQLSADKFWNTQRDADIALAGVYSLTGGTSWRGQTNMVFLDVITDNGSRASLDLALLRLTEGQLVPTNNDVTAFWNTSYQQIIKCNNFLSKIERVDMDEGEKNVMIAEVRFLRAWEYYNMSQYWGSVPLVTTVLTMQEANTVTRAPKEEIVSFVMTELAEAVQNLPETRPLSEHGRIIKSAPLAVQGRLLMSEERWEEAASVYRQIIDMGTHFIDPQYGELFDGSKEESPEIIFTTKFIENQVSNNLQLIIRPNMDGGWHFINPYQNLVDAYLSIDGETIESSPTYDPQNPFENRDPRLYQTILLPSFSEFDGKAYHGHPDSTSNGDQIGGQDPGMTGYSLKKYVDEDYQGDLYTGGSDIPIIRYAEVLLSYLEAEIKRGAPISQNLLDQTINEIRGRASVGMPPVTETNPDQLWEVLKRERRIELAWEGLRYWDLLRWREAHIKLNQRFYGMKLTDDPANFTRFPVNEEGYYFLRQLNFRENVDYQWPIPQDELDINTNLQQFEEYL
jgi:hypothetical protein